jgi:hypothetical protein
LPQKRTAVIRYRSVIFLQTRGSTLQNARQRPFGVKFGSIRAVMVTGANGRINADKPLRWRSQYVHQAAGTAKARLSAIEKQPPAMKKIRMVQLDAAAGQVLALSCRASAHGFN